MVPPEYKGAMSLGFSKYATQDKMESSGFTPAIVSTSKPITTIDQAVSIEAPLSGGDTEPSTMHSRVSRTGSQVQATEISHSVSSVITITQTFLNLLRDAIKNYASVSETVTVDHLYESLEQLAAETAKFSAHPFIAPGIAHGKLPFSAANNDDVRMIVEKVTLKSLDKAEAEKAPGKPQETEHVTSLKEQIDAKNQQLQNMQQNLVQIKITLEKQTKALNNQKVEIKILQDKYQNQSAEHAKIFSELHAREAAKNEAIGGSKAELEQLQKRIEDEKQRATKFEQEKNRLSRAFSGEQTEKNKLTTEIGILSRALASQKEEVGKLQDKNALFTRAQSTYREQNSKLVTELEKTNNATTELKEESQKLKDDIAKLRQTSLNAQEQTTKVTLELESVKKQRDDSNEQAKAESTKRNTADKEVGRLMAKLKEFRDAQAGHEQLVATLSTLKSEKSQLLTTIKELESKLILAGKANNGDSTDSAHAVKNQAMEDKVLELEKQMNGWQEAAQHAYQEYKNILPISKQVNQYRQECLDKDGEIEQLKRQISAGKASQSNGGSTDKDAFYWKKKYETLLSALG